MVECRVVLHLFLFLSCWDMSATSREEDERRYNWTWLKVPARPPSLQGQPAKALLRRNLRSMAASSGRADVLLGLEGIEELAKDAGAWAEYDDPALRSRLRRCSEQLLEIALSREGHGCFLRHLGQVRRSPDLEDLGRRFGLISQSWFVARNLCLKGAVKLMGISQVKQSFRYSKTVRRASREWQAAGLR